MSGNIFNYFSKRGKNRPLAGNSSSLQPTAGGMQSTAVGYVGKELRQLHITKIIMSRNITELTEII